MLGHFVGFCNVKGVTDLRIAAHFLGNSFRTHEHKLVKNMYVTPEVYRGLSFRPCVLDTYLRSCELHAGVNLAVLAQESQGK